MPSTRTGHAGAAATCTRDDGPMLLRFPIPVLMLLTALLAGCGTTTPAPPPASGGPAADRDEAGILPTVRRSRPRAVPAIATLRDDMDVYAQIEFWPELLREGAERAAPLNSGPFPTRLWEALKAKLAPTTTSIAVTVQPIYDETALPEMTLFRLD